MDNVCNLVKTHVFLSEEDRTVLREAARQEGIQVSTKVRQIVRAWVETRRARGF